MCNVGTLVHGASNPQKPEFRWCAECCCYVHEDAWTKHTTNIHFKIPVTGYVVNNGEVIHKSPSGATSSKLQDRYDLVPPCFIQRVAARFGLGALKHEVYNWRKGVNDEVFVQERINHILTHWNKFLEEGNEKDDNLAAVAWGISMLMEFESHPEGANTVINVRKQMTFKARPTIAELEQILGEEKDKNVSIK